MSKIKRASVECLFRCGKDGERPDPEGKYLRFSKGGVGFVLGVRPALALADQIKLVAERGRR